MFECTQTECGLAFDDVLIEKEALNRKKSFLKVEISKLFKSKAPTFDKGVKLWSVVECYTNSSTPGTGIKPFEVRDVFNLHYTTTIFYISDKNSMLNTAASGGSSTYCRSHNKPPSLPLWYKRPCPLVPSDLRFTEKQSDTIIL